jgi:4-oxalomesaconate tautomerase
MSLISPARHGGDLSTRTFIPHRVHEAIGVLGAVSVATACMVPGTVAARIADRAAFPGLRRLEIEHPTGFFTIEMDVTGTGAEIRVNRSALLRTARKLMRGEVFVPSVAWLNS